MDAFEAKVTEKIAKIVNDEKYKKHEKQAELIEQVIFFDDKIKKPVKQNFYLESEYDELWLKNDKEDVISGLQDAHEGAIKVLEEARTNGVINSDDYLESKKVWDNALKQALAWCLKTKKSQDDYKGEALEEF